MSASIGHWLAGPWSDGLTRRALLEVILLGIVAGSLGCWVVFAELSYGAESLAHSLFPGLVLAALTGLPLLLGGAIGIVAAAFAVAVVAQAPGIGRDTAVAVVVTGLFGLGVLLALSRASPPGLQGLLFGDLLGVSDSDLGLAAALALAVMAVLWVLHGRLLAAGFDRSSARALGVSPSFIDAVLLLLLALAVLVAVQGLGNLLVVAVLVGPAATARRLPLRMPAMMAAGAGLAIAGGIAGLYVSFYASVAAGACVAGVYVLAYLAAEILAATGLRRPRTALA